MFEPVQVAVQTIEVSCFVSVLFSFRDSLQCLLPCRLKPSVVGGRVCSRFFDTLAKGGVCDAMIYSFLAILATVMNGLTTAYVDACARQLGAKRLRLQMPWEESPWNDVMTKKSAALIPKPDWVDFPMQLFDPKTAVSKPTKLDRFNARVHLSEVSWVASETRQHNLALQCWKVIVLDSTSNTGLGQLLMNCIEQGKSDDYIWQVVADSFSSKATSTLRSRAASLLAFGRWKKAMCVGKTVGIFPISEIAAYEYLCELRNLHAAPSKGKRFVEAVGFAKGLLNADVSEVLNSARIKGVAQGFEKAPTRKKCPLTAEHLVYLERLATFGEGQDAIFAGYICFLVHARLRWSDGQHCIQEPVLDLFEGRGFIEAALYHHKTSQKRRTKVVRLLPVAGVLPGLSGLLWADAWLQKRKSYGLRASMTQPTMPAPVSGGKWATLPLSASEASIWLREILQTWNPVILKDVATHSCKATILSWMSKANVSLSLRRLAGYHVKPGDKSALEYSRDAAAPILRQIEAIFISIRAGIFRPDEPRSRRWHGAQTLEQAVQIASKIPVVSEHVHGGDAFHDLFGPSTSELIDHDPVAAQILREASGDSSSGLNVSGSGRDWTDQTTLEQLRSMNDIGNSQGFETGFECEASDVSDDASSMSSSDDSDSNSDMESRRAEIDGERNASDLVAPSDLAGKSCFKHMKSGKLHFVGKTLLGTKIFNCGRKCNSNYVQISDVPAFTAHGCMMCFGWSDRRDDDSSE